MGADFVASVPRGFEEDLDAVERREGGVDSRYRLFDVPHDFLVQFRCHGGDDDDGGRVVVMGMW